MAVDAVPLVLSALKIKGTTPGPRLLITGGVHGDEFEPMAAIRRLASEIVPADLSGHLTLIPVVNEAAFARGHRVADDGLDLARTCPGRPDGSITERTAFALSSHIRRADYYIDLHTGGTQLAVWPLAGYMLHPNREVLDRQRQMARDFNLPVVWGTDPRLDGRSLSIARDAEVPAIYCEYLGAAGCDSEGVDCYVNGCRNVMIGLGMLKGIPPSSCVRYIVEDHRENAGHMQVCNPSPISGFFDPAVKLGDMLQVNDLIGTVCDPLGRVKSELRSAQSGVVIVLRSFRSVRAGDSLAVVMECNPPQE